MKIVENIQVSDQLLIESKKVFPIIKPSAQENLNIEYKKNIDTSNTEIKNFYIDRNFVPKDTLGQLIEFGFDMDKNLEYTPMFENSKVPATSKIKERQITSQRASSKLCLHEERQLTSRRTSKKLCLYELKKGINSSRNLNE